MNAISASPLVKSAVRFGNDPQVGRTLQTILTNINNYTIQITPNRGYTTLEVKNNTNGNRVTITRNLSSNRSVNIQAQGTSYSSTGANDIKLCDQIIQAKTPQTPPPKKPDIDI